MDGSQAQYALKLTIAVVTFMSNSLILTFDITLDCQTGIFPFVKTTENAFLINALLHVSNYPWLTLNLHSIDTFFFLNHAFINFVINIRNFLSKSMYTVII